MSPRMAPQKRRRFPPLPDTTQPLTDAEGICGPRALGSAFNLPWDIGSQRKSSQMMRTGSASGDCEVLICPFEIIQEASLSYDRFSPWSFGLKGYQI